MNNQMYRCPRCQSVFPLSNKTLHDLRCQGPNNSQSNIHYSNNNNRNNNFNRMNNNNNMIVSMSNMNNMNNNISRNIMTNPDGTKIETIIETLPNGMQKVIRTRYDQNNNIISRQNQMQNSNNFNNININMNNMGNNFSIHSSTDECGNTTQTRTEYLPNGGVKIVSITRAPNGAIINQSTNMSSGRGNFMNNNTNMNNMGMNNIGMNNMSNDMNDMSMQNLQNMQNIQNTQNIQNMQNMQNIFNQGMSMMNNMMNNMGMMGNNMAMRMNNMNNTGFINQGMNMMDYDMMNNFMDMANNNGDNLNNGVDINLLNSLPSTQLKDVSHLESDKKQCVICMEDFNNGDEVIYLPCLHVFHKDCLFEWLRGHNDCPICKFKITYENLR